MNHFEAVIVGGSYAGLAAGMTLGRSLRKTLIVDSGNPCNAQTPLTHNFLTEDGVPPLAIKLKAKNQVLNYETVTYREASVTQVEKRDKDFLVKLQDGSFYTCEKILFATGIKDVFPEINGFEDCWGISILHCPYCHGYEFRGKKTAVLAKGETAFEFSGVIQHWAGKLTVVTNGDSELTSHQKEEMQKLNIDVIEKEIADLRHQDGQLHSIKFKDDSLLEVDALYAKLPFEQHSEIPAQLGCEFTDLGHVSVNDFGETTVNGVYAAGDNCTPMRAVSMAAFSGHKAGAAINVELIKKKLNRI